MLGVITIFPNSVHLTNACSTEVPCGSIFIEKAFEKALSEEGISQKLNKHEKWNIRQEFAIQREIFTSDENLPTYDVKLPQHGVDCESAMSGYMQISRRVSPVNFLGTLLTHLLFDTER